MRKARLSAASFLFLLAVILGTSIIAPVSASANCESESESESTERNSYFDGRFLSAEDLQEEQTYKTYEFNLVYEIDWACVQTDIWNFQIAW